LMMSARANRSDVARGLSAGADDFLLQPIPPDVLRGRLRVALRHLGGGRSPSRKVYAGLEEATAAGQGELLVRDGDSVARILVHDHAIAWAHVTDDADSLLELLSDGGVSRDDLRAALEEARRTRASFHSVLVDWGLLSAERLRDVLLAWIRRRVFAALRFANPQVLFLPLHRQGASDFCFPLHEVISSDDLASLDGTTINASASIPPPKSPSGQWGWAFLTPAEPNPAIDPYLLAAMDIEGATAAAVLNCGTGECEGRRGAPMDPGVVWSTLQAMNALGSAREEVEDFLVSTKSSFHLLRPLGRQPGRLLYLLVRRNAAMLATARLALAHLAETGAAGG
jgi:hypothetical protein